MPKFWEWLKELAKKDGVELDIPPQFSEQEIQAKIDATVATKLEAEKTRLTAEFAEAKTKADNDLKAREDAIRQKETAARRAGITSFCEGLLTKGTLTPAMMKHGMGLASFMEQISVIETPIEFGEAHDRKKQTPLEFMQSFLSCLPKAIEFDEVAGAGKDAGPKGAAAEKLEKLIQTKMQANNKLTYGAAFAEVQKENPELAAEYASAVGE